MKFSDYKYERPIYEEVKKEFISIIDKINNSCTYEEQKENIKKLNILRNNVETMATLSSIRHSINTLDEFYEKEREYWDEYSPLYEELNSLFYKSVINSKFKDNIAKDFGKQFIDIADYSLKSFSSEIIKDLQEENKLCSKYTKLLASAKIDFTFASISSTENLSASPMRFLNVSSSAKIEYSSLAKISSLAAFASEASY